MFCLFEFWLLTTIYYCCVVWEIFEINSRFNIISSPHWPQNFAGKSMWYYHKVLNYKAWSFEGKCQLSQIYFHWSQRLCCRPQLNDCCCGLIIMFIFRPQQYLDQSEKIVSYLWVIIIIGSTQSCQLLLLHQCLLLSSSSGHHYHTIINTTHHPPLGHPQNPIIQQQNCPAGLHWPNVHLLYHPVLLVLCMHLFIQNNIVEIWKFKNNFWRKGFESFSSVKSFCVSHSVWANKTWKCRILWFSVDRSLSYSWVLTKKETCSIVGSVWWWCQIILTLFWSWWWWCGRVIITGRAMLIISGARVVNYPGNDAAH